MGWQILFGSLKEYIQTIMYSGEKPHQLEDLALGCKKVLVIRKTDTFEICFKI